MRSQVINMIGYAGDITSAKSRLGIYSALIMVKGGSSDTKIKVVTCATSDGSFEDYVTLASAGASDLIAGYYVDLSGADKYIKVTGATYADVVFGDCDFDPKGIVASGSVPSGATLESNKAVAIDVSAYTEAVEVTPSSGYDGMEKATVTLSNIPSGATWVEFTSSTTHNDIPYPCLLRVTTSEHSGFLYAGILSMFEDDGEKYGLYLCDGVDYYDAFVVKGSDFTLNSTIDLISSTLLSRLATTTGETYGTVEKIEYLDY